MPQTATQRFNIVNDGDKRVVVVEFNGDNQILFKLNDGTTIALDVSRLNKKVVSGEVVVAKNRLTLKQEGGSSVDIDISALLSSSGLPDVTTSDNEKILQVKNGEWEIVHFPHTDIAGKANTDLQNIDADLSNAEKLTVRQRIGAGTSNFSGDYTDLTNKPNIPPAVDISGKANTDLQNVDSDLTDDEKASIRQKIGAGTGNSNHDGAVDTDSTLKGDGTTGSELGIADDGVGSSQIANDAVTNAKIANNAVEEEQIKDGEVKTEKLADDGVTNAKIADNAVETDQIASGAVTGPKLGANSVGTSKIANDSVTLAKMASGTSGKVIGYDSDGNPAELDDAGNVQADWDATSGAAEILHKPHVPNIDYEMGTYTDRNDDNPNDLTPGQFDIINQNNTEHRQIFIDPPDDKESFFASHWRVGFQFYVGSALLQLAPYTITTGKNSHGDYHGHYTIVSGSLPTRGSSDIRIYVAGDVPYIDDLKEVAFSGDYNDLTDKPTIPTPRGAGTGLTLNGNNLDVTNPFTDADETKLDSIEVGAQVNEIDVQKASFQDSSVDTQVENGVIGFVKADNSQWQDGNTGNIANVQISFNAATYGHDATNPSMPLDAISTQKVFDELIANEQHVILEIQRRGDSHIWYIYSNSISKESNYYNLLNLKIIRGKSYSPGEGYSWNIIIRAITPSVVNEILDWSDSLSAYVLKTDLEGHETDRFASYDNAIFGGGYFPGTWCLFTGSTQPTDDTNAIRQPDITSGSGVIVWGDLRDDSNPDAAFTPEALVAADYLSGKVIHISPWHPYDPTGHLQVTLTSNATLVGTGNGQHLWATATWTEVGDFNDVTTVGDYSRWSENTPTQLDIDLPYEAIANPPWLLQDGSNVGTIVDAFRDAVPTGTTLTDADLSNATKLLIKNLDDVTLGEIYEHHDQFHTGRTTLIGYTFKTGTDTPDAGDVAYSAAIQGSQTGAYYIKPKTDADKALIKNILIANKEVRFQVSATQYVSFKPNSHPAELFGRLTGNYAADSFVSEGDALTNGQSIALEIESNIPARDELRNIAFKAFDWTDITSGTVESTDVVLYVSPTTGKVIKRTTIGAMLALIDGLPDQSGHAGQFLKTDGTDAEWADVSLLNTYDSGATTDNTQRTVQDTDAIQGPDLTETGILETEDISGFGRVYKTAALSSLKITYTMNATVGVAFQIRYSTTKPTASSDAKTYGTQCSQGNANTETICQEFNTAANTYWWFALSGGTSRIVNRRDIQVELAYVDSASGTITGIAAGDGLEGGGYSGNVSVAVNEGHGLEISAGKVTVKADGSTLGVSADGVKVANGGIGTTQLANDAVTQAKVADDAIGNAQMRDDAITKDELADDAVETAAIKDDAVTNAKLADDSVQEEQIGDGEVKTAALAAGAVTSAKIGSGAVTEDRLGAGAVTSGKIGTDAVTNAKIGDDAVEAAQIKAGAVGTSELADDAVTAAKIASGVLPTDSEIGDKAFKNPPTNLTSTQKASLERAISAGVSAKTANYTLVSDDIEKIVLLGGTAARTFTLPDITGSVAIGWAVWIANGSTADLTIDGNGSDTIDGSATYTLKSGHAIRIATITTSSWIVLCDTMEDIADGSITTAKLANNAVTGAKVADDAIDTEHIADSAVETAQVNDGAITSAKMASGVIPTVRGAGAGLTLNGNNLDVTNPFTDADETKLDKQPASRAFVERNASAANYTVVAADDGKVIDVNTSTANKTVNLPDLGSGDTGFEVTIVKNGASNTLTIDGNGSDLVNGATTYTMSADRQAVKLRWDGTEWIVIADANKAAGGGGTLDIHEDITTQLTTVAKNDRIAISDESETGEPTKYAEVEDVLAVGHWNALWEGTKTNNNSQSLDAGQSFSEWNELLFHFVHHFSNVEYGYYVRVPTAHFSQSGDRFMVAMREGTYATNGGFQWSSNTSFVPLKLGPGTNQARLHGVYGKL